MQRIRDELRDYALYSGVAVIGDMVGEWKHIEPHLSSSGYKVSHLHDIVSLSHPHHFTTIAQSITYPERPTSAESSHSSPFVIAVFVSGLAQSAHHTLYGEVNVVNDIIQPFLPQSAPHLQHIPKLFFIIAWDSPSPVLPPQLADDPDGNYCVAYFVTKSYIRVKVWIHHIIKNLFLPSTTVSEAVENSRFFIDKDEEYLYYFTCLKNKVVLKK